MHKVLILLILSLLMVGCDIGYSQDIVESNDTGNFYSVNSTEGLYISRSNGYYIGERLMRIYGIISNGSQITKDLIKVNILLKDENGSHLKSYTNTYGPLGPGKDIPLWEAVFPVNGVDPASYELDLVESKEYHNIPPNLVEYYEGYNSFSFETIETSLSPSEDSSYWRYIVKVNVTNLNVADLEGFYLESFLYSTNGLIVDYDNEYSSELFESGEIQEFTLEFLVLDEESVYRVDFWGNGHDLD